MADDVDDANAKSKPYWIKMSPIQNTHRPIELINLWFCADRIMCWRVHLCEENEKNCLHINVPLYSGNDQGNAYRLICHICAFLRSMLVRPAFSCIIFEINKNDRQKKNSLLVVILSHVSTKS